MTEGIAWALVEKMMLDAPSYDIEDKEDDIELNSNNAEDIANFINTMM